MAYATRTDLTSLALPQAALQGISAAQVDLALEAASRLADGYLNARYQLPLTAYGSDLKKAVCDMAALMLMRGRGFSPESADADTMMSANKEAIRWLEGIAKGTISPYGLTDSSAGAVNTADLSVSARAPFAVQVQEGAVDDDAEEFWSGGQSTSGGSVTKPKRRGW